MQAALSFTGYSLLNFTRCKSCFSLTDHAWGQVSTISVSRVEASCQPRLSPDSSGRGHAPNPMLFCLLQDFRNLCWNLCWMDQFLASKAKILCSELSILALKAKIQECEHQILAFKAKNCSVQQRSTKVQKYLQKSISGNVLT